MKKLEFWGTTHPLFKGFRTIPNRFQVLHLLCVFILFMRQTSSTKPWKPSLSSWHSITYLSTTLPMHQHTDSRTFSSFLFTRGCSWSASPPEVSHQAAARHPLNQTDPPDRTAQHGELEHNQDSLFDSLQSPYLLSICTIYNLA